MSLRVQIVERSCWLTAIASIVFFAATTIAREGLRRVHVGETMPEFTLTGPGPETFRYEHERSRVLGVIVLQAGQSNSQRIGSDVEAIIKHLRVEGPAFDCVGVVSGPGAMEVLRQRRPEAQALLPLFADPNFVFWGQLGVIAAPTAIVAGADQKVRWIKAGYGYDSVAGFQAQLSMALGLGTDTDTSVQVKTLENASDRARRERHIHLARLLAERGRLEPAINELQRVYELDPNATDVALELAEVLCRAGKNEAGLKIAAEVKPETGEGKARALLISARARRQMGELDAAESLLTRVIELEPRSARAFYELGRVYDARGDVQKTLLYYRKALAEVFGDSDVRAISHE